MLIVQKFTKCILVNTACKHKRHTSTVSAKVITKMQNTLECSTKQSESTALHNPVYVQWGIKVALNS